MKKIKEKILKDFKSQEGRIGYVLAWLVGIPVPILIAVYLLRGCK